MNHSGYRCYGAFKSGFCKKRGNIYTLSAYILFKNDGRSEMTSHF